MNALGDVIVAMKEHQCVLCLHPIFIGKEAMAAAHDALLVHDDPARFVWTHPDCGTLHRRLTSDAPLYSVGWLTLQRPQLCAQCRRPMQPGLQAWRVISPEISAYLIICTQCGRIPE